MKQLPEIRQSLTVEGSHSGLKLFVTVSFFDDTPDPGEIFVNLGGPVQNPLLEAWAISASFALQSGCPWNKIKKKLASDGLIGAVVDMVAQCVSSMCCNHEEMIDCPRYGRSGGAQIELCNNVITFADSSAAERHDDDVWRWIS